MSPVPTPFSSVLVGKDLLLLAFYVLIIIYVVFTIVLYYHWQTYSNNVRTNFITFVVYFATTIPIIITLAATVAL